MAWPWNCEIRWIEDSVESWTARSVGVSPPPDTPHITQPGRETATHRTRERNADRRTERHTRDNHTPEQRAEHRHARQPHNATTDQKEGETRETARHRNRERNEQPGAERHARQS